MNNNTLIELTDVCKIFTSENVETHALSKINLNIQEGDYLSIVGPSGCGKSTLLSILGLLDSPTSGTYKLAGKDVSSLNRNQQSKVRNQHIGFVFQSFNLISDLSVQDNVELPLQYRSNLSATDRRNAGLEALKKVGMENRAKHYPSQLSGGQQQRVAIARAIVTKPSIIFADEPTGNLDTVNSDSVMKILSDLNSAGTTICLVTHDPRSDFTRRQINIIDGQLINEKSMAKAG